MIQNIVFEELHRTVKEIYGRDVDIRMEQHLEDDLGLDSLDRIELWMDVEDKFNLDIPEEEVKNLKYVHEYVKLIQEKTGKE